MSSASEGANSDNASDYDDSDLRQTVHELRNKIEKLTAAERQQTRSAAESRANWQRTAKRNLAAAEASEARERMLIASWEDEVRAATAMLRDRTCGRRRRHRAHSHFSNSTDATPVPRHITPQPSVAAAAAAAAGTGGAPMEDDQMTTDTRSFGGPSREGSDCDCSSDSNAADDENEASRSRPQLHSDPSTPALAVPPAAATARVVNPNVHGTPVESQSNRQWYLAECVRKALLGHISAAFTAAGGTDPTAAAAAASSTKHPGAASGDEDGVPSDDDDADPAYRQEKWAAGDIATAAAEALQKSSAKSAGDEGARRRRGLFGALASVRHGGRKVAAAAARLGDGSSASGTVKYHCHLEQGIVVAEAGLDRAGRLRSITADATSAALRERFGLRVHENGMTSEDDAARKASSVHAGFNSFERLYGTKGGAAPAPAQATQPSTASSPSASDASQQPRGEYRVDEISITFHRENELAAARASLGITAEDIMASCGPRCYAWRVGGSPGKSDSMFLYFGHYVAKSVNETEFRLLQDEFLPAYVEHTARSPHTLLPHFSFLFTIRWLASRRAMHFVVMNNVFRTANFIQRMYDLKGSTVGRDGVDAATGKVTTKTGFGAVLLKDNDVPDKLLIVGPMRRAMLVAQLQSDTAFLQRLNIVDYSLLVGQRSRTISGDTLMPPSHGPLSLRSPVVGSQQQHFRSQSAAADGFLGATLSAPAVHVRSMSQQSASTMAPGKAAEPSFNYDPTNPEQLDGRCFRCTDGGMVSLPIHESASGRDAREDTFYIGLIDVLQPFSGAKKIENIAKSLFYDGSKISVIPPHEFAARLCALVERITV